VDSVHRHRRPRKIRRTGRHAAPSQVEKVAEKAGKAAPAVAIAGALVAAAPQAHAAVRTPAKATTVTERRVVLDSSTASAVSFSNPIGQGLIAGRIDMGVDFGGAGPLYALGSGTIVSVYNSGWPGGVFIVIQLDSGQYVYYAEDVAPAVVAGQRVAAGALIGHATGGGDGIEIGWADGAAGDTMAMRYGQQSPTGDPGSRSTGYGASMNALLVSLGAPSGQLQGPVYGSAPGVVAARTDSSGAGVHRAAAPVAGAATAGENFYVVRPGDTLSGIARQACGAARDWVALWQANPFITDPDLIYPGSRLKDSCITVASPLAAAGPSAGDSGSSRSGSSPSASQGQDSDDAAGGSPGAQYSQASPPAALSAVGGYGNISPSSGPGGAFGACVISRESGGNSQVMNSTGHYGLYQFSASTWAAYGGNPADFGHATVAEQEQVFSNALAAGGQSNWSPYDGC
jgi:Transglycosylase-like domain/LysM domain